MGLAVGAVAISPCAAGLCSYLDISIRSMISRQLLSGRLRPLPSPWSRLRGKVSAFFSSHVSQEKGALGARSALRVDQVTSFPNLTLGVFVSALRLRALLLPLLLFACISAADSV